MLVISPLSAVTKVPIEVCAPLESVLTVKVVGVSVVVPSAALLVVVLSRLMVTPLMTAVTWLLALVAAKPLTVKLASIACWVWVSFDVVGLAGS